MLDKEKLAKSLESMRSGIYVVTSAHEGEPAGCTAVWITRASFNPPLLAVTLSASRHTFATIEASKKFCVNVLGESSLDTARRFGFNSGPDSSKFSQVSHHTGENGMPVLDIAVAYFECQVRQILDTGDHKLVLGEVVSSAMQSSERPAVYEAESFYSESQNHIEAGSSGS